MGGKNRYRVTRGNVNELTISSEKRYEAVSLLENSEEETGLNVREASRRLRDMEGMFWKLYVLEAEAMTFDLEIYDRLGSRLSMKDTNEGDIHDSAHWKRIGSTLCSFGEMVGAELPQSVFRHNPKGIVAALKLVANNEGRTISVLLARLEGQSITIRQQEQAITALQFRQLLEMIPGGGTPPTPGEATKKWQEFWMNAVTEAYRQHLNPKPAIVPSPLIELMKREFCQAALQKNGRNDEERFRNQVHWLLYKRDISERAQALFGTLSQIIHSYSPQEAFSVSGLAYGPVDVKILGALKPKPKGGQDGDKWPNWSEEKERFIPSSHTLAVSVESPWIKAKRGSHAIMLHTFHVLFGDPALIPQTGKKNKVGDLEGVD